MKEEEMKAARAAAEALKQNRDAAMATVKAAVDAQQPDLEALRAAIADAEAADLGNDPNLQTALSLTNAADKISVALENAQKEGDTAALQSILDSVMREENVCKLINPMNKRLQRRVNNENEMIEDENT